MVSPDCLVPGRRVPPAKQGHKAATRQPNGSVLLNDFTRLALQLQDHRGGGFWHYRHCHALHDGASKSGDKDQLSQLSTKTHNWDQWDFWDHCGLAGWSTSMPLDWTMKLSSQKARKNTCRAWPLPWAFASEQSDPKGLAMLCYACLGTQRDCFEAYTRFQDITWQLIPEGSEWANVMGFNVMCRPLLKMSFRGGEWWSLLFDGPKLDAH